MNPVRLSLLALLMLAVATPALAQRGGHPGGGPATGGTPGDRGSSDNHGSATTSGGNSSTSHADLMHATPGDVLARARAIASE